MADLVERLHALAYASIDDLSIADEAAEEIKRLCTALDGMLQIYGGTTDIDGLPKHHVEIECIAQARSALKQGDSDGLA